MEHYLKEYNTVSKAPMPLVMFRYATEHASRINRIIKQRGKILYVKTFEIQKVRIYSFHNTLGWLLSARFKYKPGYRPCDLLQIRVLSLGENLFFKKNPLQYLLSSLNTANSTNERN